MASSPNRPDVPSDAPVARVLAGDSVSPQRDIQPDMTPELWERVQELFDRMLESSDPLATAAGESDPRVRKLAGELWDNHLRASGAGFLDRPITLVRNISGA